MTSTASGRVSSLELLSHTRRDGNVKDGSSSDEELLSVKISTLSWYNSTCAKINYNL